MLSAMRLRTGSISITFTFTKSPDLTTACGSFTKRSAIAEM
jgi:hypothetical protein